MTVRRFSISFLNEESPPGSPSSRLRGSRKIGGVNVGVTPQRSVGTLGTGSAMPKRFEKKVAVASTQCQVQTYGLAEDSRRCVLRHIPHTFPSSLINNMLLRRCPYIHPL